MKQCRFCDNEIPFYGPDTCSECLLKFREQAIKKQTEKPIKISWVNKIRDEVEKYKK